jgi:hypothetical protein
VVSVGTKKDFYACQKDTTKGVCFYRLKTHRLTDAFHPIYWGSRIGGINLLEIILILYIILGLSVIMNSVRSINLSNRNKSERR